MPKEKFWDYEHPEGRQLTVVWGSGSVDLVVWDIFPETGRDYPYSVRLSDTEQLYRLEYAIRRARRSLDKKLTREAAEYLESKITIKNPER